MGTIVSLDRRSCSELEHPCSSGCCPRVAILLDGIRPVGIVQVAAVNDDLHIMSIGHKLPDTVV